MLGSPSLPKLIGKGEALLLLSTIAFQVVSLFTLLRVASGVASITPQSNSSAPFVIPHSLNQSISVPSSTPQFQNPLGSGLNSSLVLAIVFVGANIVVISLLALLYRKKRMKLFSIVVSVFLIFNVTELYFSFLIGLYSLIPIVVAVAASIATVVSAFYGKASAVNLIALFLALELGSSFPVLLQAPLNWIIPLVYALFDIYAIYFGKLGKLVTQVGNEKPLESSSAAPKKRGLGRWPEFGLLTVNFPNMEIGMADIAFYTMVPAVALILVSLFAFFVVLITVDAGLLISFYLFRNKEVAPGLPVPILLGLGALLVTFLLH
jgi:hypothetical protein